MRILVCVILCAVLLGSRTDEQRVFIAHDLARYFHVLSDVTELHRDNALRDAATEKLRLTSLEHTNIEHTFQGPSRKLSSPSVLGGVSSGSDLSLSARKARFLLGPDELSSQSDNDSQLSLDSHTDR